MKMQLIIRRFAGVFILASLVLAHYHSQYWLWFTAFVGWQPPAIVFHELLSVGAGSQKARRRRVLLRKNEPSSSSCCKK